MLYLVSVNFLAEDKHGYYAWKFDIFESEKQEELLKVIFEILASGMRNHDNNPQSVGKDAMLWQLVRTQVLMKAYMSQWL
ncbi:hypothetical protein ACT7DG_25640 [Bacillus cereus]